MSDDTITALAETTLQRIDALLSELDAFSAAYKRKRDAATRLERREMPDPIPGLHDFVVEIKGTKNSVQRVLTSRQQQQQAGGKDQDEDEEKNRRDRAVLQGCGLAPHQEQWNAIKRAQGLLSFRRRFNGSGGGSSGGGKRRLGPTVDAVVENGMEWLKVVNVTEKKLLYQLAQDGWHPDDSSSSEGEDDDDDDEDDDYDENTGVVLLKTMKQLVAAARTNRCNTRIPRIRVVLPNLVAGRVPAIDRIIDRTRNLGTPTNPRSTQKGDVQILIDYSPTTQPPDLATACTNLFRDTTVDRLTPTVNLELTLILSLVSDITHDPSVTPREWYSRQTLSHLTDERHAPGRRLHDVYAALRGRRLECTHEVAREVRNIVADLGTEATRARTLLLFGRESLLGDAGEGFLAPRTSCHEKEEEEARRSLVAGLRELSEYPVPDDLLLPIQIVGDDEFHHGEYAALIAAGRLPPVAAKVWAKLDRDYNRSCYLWGWLADITTVSANNLNTRLIDVTVDKHRTSALDVGPRLYLSPLAISINTCKPCPEDKWSLIKDAKHERKEARTREAKQLKAAGVWGPALGIPVKWDEKHLLKQDMRRSTSSSNQGAAADGQH